ncbi:uncharacterized protein HVO_A0464 (plasmid) [Haloferax volcanii DS2]|uniref:RNA ligase domain-containing protein n=3 Tax=Haloferax volcanii TaxID=2246 RepID=D4GRC9_HALVD|nr:uncharacterized protein HVO_A0464 [Haloferax volcanii DS2]
MKPYPSTPLLADAPEGLLSSGHLWLREHVAGPRLRFQMKSSGRLLFGDRDCVFDDAPPPHECAVRHVRERFDRDAFRDAVDEPRSYVFFGVAPCHVGIDYDWERMPPFLGRAIWNETDERLVPIDESERVFERLGLTPVNTFQKELNVRDFHPDRLDIPESAWYDGPAAGVIVENRRGGRALVQGPVLDEVDDYEPIRGEPNAIAADLVTDTRVRRAIEAAEAARKSPTTDEVHARVFETAVREEYGRLDRGRVDWKALRSAIGSAVAEKRSTLTER